MSSKTPAIMVGDSGMYGAAPGGRLAVTPHMVLQREQSVFDFISDYSHGGASFAGVMSDIDHAREGSGMPGGMTFRDLVVRTPAHGILISLGGNDNAASPSALVSNICRMAAIVHGEGKVCAFVGIPDISVPQSIQNTSGQWGSHQQYMETAAAIAHNADLIRQACRVYGLPYIDVRNSVASEGLDITGDLVHPNQAYSTAIYTHVARALEASY